MALILLHAMACTIINLLRQKVAMVQYIVRVTATLGCIQSMQSYPDHYLLVWKTLLTYFTVHIVISKTSLLRSYHLN